MDKKKTMEETKVKERDKNDNLIDIFKLQITKKKAKLFLIMDIVIVIISSFVLTGSISSIFYTLRHAESIDPYFTLPLVITSLYSLISTIIIYMISFSLAKKLWRLIH